MPFDFQKPITTLLAMTSQWRFDKQQFILFINYHLIIVLLKESLATHRVHLPAGRRAITHRAQRTERAADQLFRFRHKGPVASKFANGLSRVGAMLEAYSKLKTKPKTIAKVKEALQVIWSNLPQKPFDKAVKDLSN